MIPICFEIIAFMHVTFLCTKIYILTHLITIDVIKTVHLKTLFPPFFTDEVCTYEERPGGGPTNSQSVEQGITLEACQTKCTDSSECLSITFSSGGGQCYINTETTLQEGSSNIANTKYFNKSCEFKTCKLMYLFISSHAQCIRNHVINLFISVVSL